MCLCWVFSNSWCYSPSTRKYFVSAGVTFFESVSYFSPQGPVTASSISMSPSAPLPAPAVVHDVSVGYYRTQKGYRCYSPSTRKYFVSADVTFFESVLYLSPQCPVTALESISLSLSVLLPAPAVVHDVSSPVSLKDTTAPPASKLPREKIFRHVYTHRQKVLPLNRFRPPPL